MRLTLDTNILAYAEGVNGVPMKKLAFQLVQGLPQEETFLPVQVLGELLNLLVRKAGRTPAKARSAILSWQDAFPGPFSQSRHELLTALRDDTAKS